MLKKNSILSFIMMHIAFIIYSFASIFSKAAIKQDLFSFSFFIYLFLLFLFIGLYAFLWQQVLKVYELSFAYTNKCMILFWGLFFGKILFNESITLFNIIGLIIVFIGVSIIVGNKNNDI